MTASWGANGNPAGTSYTARLYRSADNALIGTITTTATSATFTGLAGNETYYANVYATSGAGVTTSAVSLGTVTTPANPPASLAATATQTTVSLTWDGSSNKAGTTYRVYVNGVLNGSTTASSYTISGLTPGTTYNVGVSAVGPSESAQTTLSKRTVPPDPVVSGSNGGLAWVQSDGRGYVTLSWPAATGATGYKLYVFDGYAYRMFDLGNVTSWDSRVARIYPAESALDGYADNTVTSDLFNHIQGGLDLRDNPNKLYRKTAGSTYDNATQYWFRVTAYNESGETGLYAAPSGYFPTLPVRTDSTPPVVTNLQINGGAQQTGAANVSLDVTFSDDLSGVAALSFSNDRTTWSTWEPVTPSTSGTYHKASWLMLAGPGSKTVYARAKDQAGNISAEYQSSIWLAYDTTNPTVQLTINGGAAMTPTANVTLAINASSALTAPTDLQMRFSNDSGATWTAWEPYAASKAWTLSGGDGLKTVLCQVKNQAGNVGQALAQIQLQSVGSVANSTGVIAVGGATAATIMQNGQPVTAALVNNPQISMTLTPGSGVSAMTFSVDGVNWSPQEPFASPKALVLPGGDGPKTVYTRFVDANGRAGPVYTSQVVLDTTAPAVTAEWLDGATVTRAGGSQDAVIVASDNISAPGDLMVSINGGAWQAYDPANPRFTVSFTGTGAQVATVRVKDQAGNITMRTLTIYVIQ